MTLQLPVTSSSGLGVWLEREESERSEPAVHHRLTGDPGSQGPVQEVNWVSSTAGLPDPRPPLPSLLLFILAALIRSSLLPLHSLTGLPDVSQQSLASGWSNTAHHLKSTATHSERHQLCLYYIQLNQRIKSYPNLRHSLSRMTRAFNLK